jgi:hypothetical protein
MLNAVVHIINDKLTDKIFRLRQFTNHKLFRIAEQAFRSTDGALFPYIPSSGEWVGVDDRRPVVAYHRSLGSAVTLSKSGFGDIGFKKSINFSMLMTVFMDESITKMKQDELYLYMMAAFPERIKIEFFDYISVRINSVILNSQQVWRAEFPGTPYNLNPMQSLMAINYTIESEFKSDCFNSCPED